MNRLRSFVRLLRRDSRGATVVEFALLAPVFMSVLIGVFETGIYMQNYNAVRNVAADAARFAAVEYQKNNQLGTEDLKLNIETIAQQSPYNLSPNRLQVTVTPVLSRVVGAKEFNLQVKYTPPGFMEGLGMDGFNLSYSRPLFVLDNTYIPPAP